MYHLRVQGEREPVPEQPTKSPQEDAQATGPRVGGRGRAAQTAAQTPRRVTLRSRLEHMLPFTHLSRGAWAAVTVVLLTVGVAAALMGARAVTRTDTDNTKLAFHLSSTEIAATLKLAIQHEEDLVVNASAFVAWNPRATPLEFDRWVQSVRALQRYPELENIGLVALVPATGLKAFEKHIEAHPVEPFGPHSARMSSHFEILPPGRRPFYCFAVAGLSRNLATYLPSGLDFCELAKTLPKAREEGLTSYAPFVDGSATTLGVQTPVYRGGRVPTSVAARRRDFIGWLGELLVPNVVLDSALAGHPGTAVRFSYRNGLSSVVFNAGRAPRHSQTSTISLHNGWTVQSFGAPLQSGVFEDPHALLLLIGGTLLSLMLSLLVLVLGTSRTRALSLVSEKTRELSHQALHDALTGLPNRALVLDRADQMLARTARTPGTVAGALFVDVDGFKHVNDKLGHAAGDRLLKVVGERLQTAVRGQDTVGRLGGDEFVVLVESPVTGAQLDLFADRLIEVLRQPVELDDGRKIFSVTASIGLAVGQYNSPDDLLRDADLALYAAKAAGKDRYVLFDASMYDDAEGRLELELDLSAALQDEQFFLLYQPIFDLRRGKLVAVEALVRWHHPVRGVIPPGDFVPLAEENGLIVPIGRWVLDEACRQAAAWLAEGRRIGVSVNVSAFQLGRKSFAEDVRRALRESGIEPGLLTLEITETTLMRDVTGACERLSDIRELGVHIAIDDFGTGYASLSNLQQMPVDILKVDRSFIAALNEGGQSRELLGAILGVGQALSLLVVAEGIEVQSQMNTLMEMGVQLAQGFLMGRPSTADVIEGIVGPDTLREASETLGEGRAALGKGADALGGGPDSLRGGPPAGTRAR
jgi:diguanylate cyclase (GGDEF)-like protein